MTYPAHHHGPREVYLVMTPGVQWQLDEGDWFEVQAGDLAGVLHFVEDVDTPPIELHYQSSGIVWMAPGPGRVQRGDVVFVLMKDYVDDWGRM